MTIQCKGSFVLGTACGYCHKCAQEASKLIPQYKAEIMGLYKDTAELAAYKAEAMAAREYIKYLESNLMWGVRSEEEFERQEQMYLTALVKDE